MMISSIALKENHTHGKHVKVNPESLGGKGGKTSYMDFIFKYEVKKLFGENV